MGWVTPNLLTRIAFSQPHAKPPLHRYLWWFCNYSCYDQHEFKDGIPANGHLSHTPFTWGSI